MWKNCFSSWCVRKKSWMDKNLDSENAKSHSEKQRFLYKIKIQVLQVNRTSRFSHDKKVNLSSRRLSVSHGATFKLLQYPFAWFAAVSV